MNWTNNARESPNLILKQSINWKALRIPDLIVRRYEIIKLQEDLKRSIRREGNHSFKDIKKRRKERVAKQI